MSYTGDSLVVRGLTPLQRWCGCILQPFPTASLKVLVSKNDFTQNIFCFIAQGTILIYLVEYIKILIYFCDNQKREREWSQRGRIREVAALFQQL